MTCVSLRGCKGCPASFVCVRQLTRVLGEFFWQKLVPVFRAGERTYISCGDQPRYATCLCLWRSRVQEMLDAPAAPEGVWPGRGRPRRAAEP